MKLQTAVFALMGMIFLFTAKSSAQQVSTDYQSGANFEHYKTYSWGQVKADNPQDIDRIKNAVDGALTAKGWTQLDSGADVSITATAGEKTSHPANACLLRGHYRRLRLGTWTRSGRRHTNL